MKKILATILMVLMLTATVFADTKKPESASASTPTAAELETKMEELTKQSEENQAKYEELRKRFETIMKAAETKAAETKAKTE